MKLLPQIRLILAKYNFKPIKLPKGYKNIYDYLKDNLDKENEYKSDKNDGYLIKKYRKYIPKGWYGFSLGSPTPVVWNEIIDEIVELCIKNDPNFEIHQIKEKLGYICFYVQTNVIEDIEDIEDLLADELDDKALIY